MACYVITGGGGFLGKALALRLRALGHEVRTVARGTYPELAAAGIQHTQLDLAAPGSALTDLCRGAEAVFHVAAKVDMWGEYHEFFQANVVGTRHVLDACRAAQVPYLIFTSSPSVIADGKDLCGIDESYPYPRHYEAFYPQTKAQAEQEVLNEGLRGGVRTVALRPHLIFGPGDTNLIPSILRRAGAGKLMQVGEGKNRTDLCYIEDCVEAHLCALRALKRNAALSGKVYFISQGEPVNLWDWVNEVLDRARLAPVRKKVSKKLAMFLAGILEKVCRLLPGNPEPRFTRFLVSEMATSHYFDISAAKRDLGFVPHFTVSEGMEKVVF